MTTFLQLHLLTAYPPANLNRDDNGQPKTAIFGGVPRLRVSSQSLKRAWRTSEVIERSLVGAIGVRTQQVGRLVREALLRGGLSEAHAASISRTLAEVVGTPVKKTDKDQSFTVQLVFLAPMEIERFRSFAGEILRDKKLRDELLSYGGETEQDGEEIQAEENEQPAEKKTGKAKGISKKRLGEIRDTLLMNDGGAVDIAMFGRMLADSPKFNFEAAVQVAHAISTHRVTIEDDYYVAVDDLKSAEAREDAGTSFIGVQEFAAGVFYLYICIDLDLLLGNLSGDRGLAKAAVAALTEAAATVAPRGKQASFASRARASYILAEAGSDQPRSLAAAFLKPVSGDDDFAKSSAVALKRFREKLTAAYGDSDTRCEIMDITGDGVAGSLQGIVAFAKDAVPEASSSGR